MKSNQSIKTFLTTPLPKIVRGCSISGKGVFNSTKYYEQIRVVQVQSIGLDYGQNFTGTRIRTRRVYPIMLRLLEPRLQYDRSRGSYGIVPKRVQKIVPNERS